PLSPPPLHAVSASATASAVAPPARNRLLWVIACSFRVWCGPRQWRPACCILACDGEPSPPAAAGNRFLALCTLLCCWQGCNNGQGRIDIQPRPQRPRTLARAAVRRSTAANAGVRDGTGSRDAHKRGPGEEGGSRVHSMSEGSPGVRRVTGD